MTLRTGIANTPYTSIAYATDYIGIINDDWYGYTVKTEAEKTINIKHNNTDYNSTKKKEENMIKIENVSVKYETKTFVDKTRRDENGNYVVTKKEMPIATIVVFENGSTQAAYCNENDNFNLEIGISICVTREFMKRLYGIKDDTSAYNKIIRHGMKTYKNHCKAVEKTKKLVAEQEAIERNRKIKEQKRREKRAAKKKEREIEILAEAIRRANADSK
jgi:hypothetical protein